MADLITTAQAKRHIVQPSFSSDEDTLIGELIDAVGAAIEKYCRRRFDSQTFDELYDGDGQEPLLLRQFPVVSVSRVAYAPTPVLRVRNTSGANQRATVAVTTTGLSLVRVASGVSSTDTVAFATFATIQAVANQIDALGNGWDAEAVAEYALRASADFRAPQGAFQARDAWAELKMHTEELSDYVTDAARGWLWRGEPGDVSPESGWDGGVHYWRVVYTAGFATVPGDVQEACAEWVAALFWLTKRDPGARMETTTGASKLSVLTEKIPASVQALLEPYRKRVL